MQIDDTLIVTTGGELTIPSDATPEQAHEMLGQLLRTTAQQASALARKDKPFYRTFALSVAPLLYEHAGKRMVEVVTIVALVPDPLALLKAPKAFQPGGPGSTN